MTDYTKYKKVISKYKFKRILQNRRADLCVVYLMKKTEEYPEPVRVSGVLLDGYLYTANTRHIHSGGCGVRCEDTLEAFRYKVDGEFRSDDIAFFVTRRLYPF
jgi:uncharacterized protein YijF (DUF1287 family)